MPSLPWGISAFRDRLLAARTAAGHWEGELSSSPLSTATAVTALTIVGGYDTLVTKGLRWLTNNQNVDGGFGDAPRCPSNISTTTLAWATLSANNAPGAAAAETWLRENIGAPLTAESITRAISGTYGEDKTFAVPILTHCSLAGRFGWDHIPVLPFELAAIPHSLFKWIGLPVVSYALPALIAIGYAQHYHYPTEHKVAHTIRQIVRTKTLRVLESIQPASGGFLEATPLTSFVTMSLASSGLVGHSVTQRGARFLASSIRDDGSWPIDTNLATWLTTLSINALGVDAFTATERTYLRSWLLDQQYKEIHPYTQSPPGGWAWTDLSGSVPDGDDTAGALLALATLGNDAEIRVAATAGARWLIKLQNSDGGIPTFCRGWGKLPFDQSSPDLTAHALRAWNKWRSTEPRIDAAMERAVSYLVQSQQNDGSWIPLWFGNPSTQDQTNPIYGTARVLECGNLIPRNTRLRAEQYLASVQQPNGSFGTIEETALAVAVLGDPRGTRWLAEQTHFEASPIGLYFAKLWYSEKLYPLIFTVAALNK
ncbi:MAG: squalene--hopene cyclase [Acidobacteria bacterium]|nr:squalene--hopene cyclase [Acidobacteriota bacterium]